MKIKRLIATMLICAMLAMGGAFADTISADSDMESIRAVQSKLQTMQLLTADQVNGVWADSTTIAVVRFQRFVNNVQGAGTLEENGVIDDATAQYLDFAAGKGWNVAAEVPEDSVSMPIDPEVAAAQAEEAARAQAEQDEATIAYVQTMLRQLGLIDEVNGVYDDTTKAAIMTAQQYINANYGANTVTVNGAFNDPETMGYLNRFCEDGITIARADSVPVQAETETDETAEATEPQATLPTGTEPEPTAVPSSGVITDFVLTINDAQQSGTVELTPGTYRIAWSGNNVAMFSMYMYGADGTLLNKNENMSVNYFNLDTFGMAAGAVYEIRIGAVPVGGQVADMEWRSLFLTLKS